MKNILPALIPFILLQGCSPSNESSEKDTRENFSEILGSWTLKTRIITFENETFIEDAKQGDCSYPFYILTKNQKKENHEFNTEKDCLEEISTDSWEYDKESKKLATINEKSGFETIYEIQALNDEELKLKIISEGGDLLQNTGFEITLILEK